MNKGPNYRESIGVDFEKGLKYIIQGLSMALLRKFVLKIKILKMLCLNLDVKSKLRCNVDALTRNFQHRKRRLST